MAVDCRGNFSWCSTNQKIDESDLAMIAKSPSENSSKCLAFAIDTFFTELKRFNCDEKLLFACEALNFKYKKGTKDNLFLFLVCLQQFAMSTRKHLQIRCMIFSFNGITVFFLSKLEKQTGRRQQNLKYLFFIFFDTFTARTKISSSKMR